MDRVLLIEDQNPRLLQALLELYGHFEYDVATTGDEALEKLAQGPRPELVLLDLRLPGVAGLDVLSVIRKEILAYR